MSPSSASCSPTSYAESQHDYSWRIRRMESTCYWRGCCKLFYLPSLDANTSNASSFISEPNVTKGPFDTVTDIPLNTNLSCCQHDQPFDCPSISRTSFPIATSHSPTIIALYDTIPSLSDGLIRPNLRFGNRERIGVS